MRGYNAALVAYKAMDLESLPLEEDKKPSGGLLAPKKSMTQNSDMSKQPIMRVAKHMKILRKQREQVNGSN